MQSIVIIKDIEASEITISYFCWVQGKWNAMQPLN